MIDKPMVLIRYASSELFYIPSDISNICCIDIGGKN